MSEKAVTRFAPSPTGYLHVGGARTAIFSWLWARHMGGKFVLRIEDTDIKRNTPTAMRQVINDLRWLGIDWDEGPEVGGPNEPYLQSQRQQQGVYDKYVNQLLKEGKAYYCFDTPEELEAMREESVAQKKNLTYPRPEKFPDESDVEKARAQGKPITVRFAVPQQDIVVQDVVRGEVRFAAGEINDFIIQKSDRFPTYNFACVVDDYLMQVTHVIRGQEHLMNTPSQQALWQALGFGQPPTYAHMSVTVSPGGGKLSKRERPKALREEIKKRPDVDLKKLAQVGGVREEEVDAFIQGKITPDVPAIDAMAEYLGVPLPEINVVDFFKSGYLPQTMVNFLALLGWNPGDDREIMSVDELISSFDLSRLTKANSLFDRDKLLSFNTEHIRRAGEEELLGHFKSYLRAVSSPLVSASDEMLRRVIRACEGARTLADIDRKSQFLLLPDDQIEYDEKAVKKVLLKNEGLAVLATVRHKLAALEEFTPENIETMLRDLAEKKQVGLGKVAQPLRVALCGTTISLPIFDSVEMLGKQGALARIDVTLKKFGAQRQAERT
jgi:glutamyl/glutaminyl-tRNA synthetase